jgi:hypothetical protein
MLNPETLTSHAGDGERLLVDELYERILGDAFRDARVRAPRLRILHTIICAESRIDMSVLADLTNTDQGTVKRVVESLHAVLFVSPKDGCVYWYHASFPDFVFSQTRAKISIFLRQNYATHHIIDVFCDRLLIMGTSPDGASPLCRSPCISICVTFLRHMSSILRCLGSMLPSMRHSLRLSDTCPGIGRGI